ncbi:hypothetical protein C8J56DRAFT_141831 [Mycena floridula]|nr:hypothetical protein C8J56DRAFT_141831 [Mycena floridula]
MSDFEATSSEAEKDSFKDACSESDVNQRPKKRKFMEPSKAKANDKANKKKQPAFKSPEMVPSSDMEQDEPDEPSATKSTAGASDPRKATATKKSKLVASKTVNNDEADDAESDQSKPKKRRKSKENDAKKPKEKNATAKPKTGGDEERIKRLKSLVSACGVRKVWSKVFQDAPNPSQQILILKRMLTELGMSGRTSMEQAKAIKEKRELAAELEDVQTFEKAIRTQSLRSKGKSVSEPQSEEDADSEGDEEEAVVRPKRKTARQSIAAFLGSDSE